FFVQYVTSQNLDVPVGFDFERGGCTAVVHVYGKIGRYLDGSCLFGEGEFGIRRIVAAELLEALLNYTSALPFTMEEDAPMIKRDDSKVYTSALADLMIEGKVGACPWCGRPMLLLRKTSKPFCRQSHQTRYNEKARKMLVDGASVNDVIASFEHIQPATIRNWNLAK
ncbi:MAG: hypothetical protein IJ087_10430, partial [Eggerthellaceae bacterium]|nr:hypothetical protein [Eggerthellaceae bacterium]